MPRYKLRTLLIAGAVGPPALAVCFWNWPEVASVLVLAGGALACWFDGGWRGPAASHE